MVVETGVRLLSLLPLTEFILFVLITGLLLYR
nr:MAG TPA: hypothetical protein [Caudoviricetes sp.]